MPKIKITQTRSVIRHTQTQKDTIKSLGLGRPNNTAVHEDTPQLRGMIAKVRHLITTESAE